MDDIRAQLDALMGEHRNVPLSEREKYINQRKFSDKEVCKYFLVGFCPHEEFRRTKNDCGDCPLVHDEGCRAQWEALDDRSKERYGYESELLSWFDRLLGDLRKRIDANTKRLEGLEAPPPLLPEDQQRLDGLTAQMKELVARAEALGEEGDVDGAAAATAQSEQLRVQRNMAEAAAVARANARIGRNLHQKVCQISGLIINDEESRLQDHYSGRNYNSWKKLHDVHAKLLEAQRLRRASGVPAAPPGPAPGSAGGREHRGGSEPRSSHRDERERDGRRYDDRRRRDDRNSRRDDRRDDRRRYDDRDRRDSDRRDSGRRRSRSRSRDRDRRRRSRSGSRDDRRRSRHRSRSREQPRSARREQPPPPAPAPAPPAQADFLPVAAGPEPYGAPGAY